ADLTQSLLPESMAKEVAAEHGVAGTARIFLFNTKRLLVLGYARSDFPAQRMVVTRGRQASGDEAMLGDAAEARLHLHAGERLQLGKRSFRIAGLYHTGNAFVDNGAVLPLRAVQQPPPRPSGARTLPATGSLGRPPKHAPAP